MLLLPTGSNRIVYCQCSRLRCPLFLFKLATSNNHWQQPRSRDSHRGLFFVAEPWLAKIRRSHRRHSHRCRGHLSGRGFAAVAWHGGKAVSHAQRAANGRNSPLEPPARIERLELRDGCVGQFGAVHMHPRVVQHLNEGERGDQTIESHAHLTNTALNTHI